MAKALIEQAKAVDLKTLGYNMMHGGSFVVLDCPESGDNEQINLGDDLLVFFALGVMMERRRQEAIAPKQPEKKTPTRRKETVDVKV